MEINNKNIWWVFPIISNVIFLIFIWNGWYIHPIKPTLTGVISGIMSVIIDIALLVFFFLNCINDFIKFSFKIPIPFQHYFKDKKTRKEIESQILKLKIDLGRTPLDHTWETDEIVKKIEILQAEKYNKYEKDN